MIRDQRTGSRFPVPGSVLLIVLAACQSGGGGTEQPTPAPIDAEPLATPLTAEDAGTIAELPTEQGTPTDEPDLGRAVEDLGAIPAWQAVVDRDQYLARRGQQGVVFGRVGPIVPPRAATGADAGVPPPTGLTWLVDDTEGNGALAIRVQLADPAPVEGERIAVAGAWALDDERRWFWQGGAVTALPASDTTAPKDPIAPPGLAIAIADAPGKRKYPDKVQPGELMEFTVKKRPLRVGDGWPITSERGSELMAYLILPGERASYGGHDLRGPDEKWSLKVGATYWVRVGRIRPARGEDPPIIRAVTRPVRFP